MGAAKPLKTFKPATPATREARFLADVRDLIPEAARLALKVEAVAQHGVRIAGDPTLGPLFREVTELLWALDVFRETAAGQLGKEAS